MKYLVNDAGIFTDIAASLADGGKLRSKLSLFVSCTLLIVFFRMATMIRKKEIFDIIVFFISVYVVYYFIFRKVAAKMFFHHKSVFLNISVLFRKWMIGNMNKNVSMAVKNPTAFPVPVTASRVNEAHFDSCLKSGPSFACRYSHLLNGFFRILSSLIPWLRCSRKFVTNFLFTLFASWNAYFMIPRAATRTILNAILPCSKFFKALFASFNNHIDSFLFVFYQERIISQ